MFIKFSGKVVSCVPTKEEFVKFGAQRFGAEIEIKKAANVGGDRFYALTDIYRITIDETLKVGTDYEFEGDIEVKKTKADKVFTAIIVKTATSKSKS